MSGLSKDKQSRFSIECNGLNWLKLTGDNYGMGRRGRRGQYSFGSGDIFCAAGYYRFVCLCGGERMNEELGLGILISPLGLVAVVIVYWAILAIKNFCKNKGGK
jgi:hypothetical protein